MTCFSIKLATFVVSLVIYYIYILLFLQQTLSQWEYVQIFEVAIENLVLLYWIADCTSIRWYKSFLYHKMI